MRDQSHLHLALVEAKTIAEGVPADLPALQFFVRPTVGRTVRLCAVGDIGLSGRAAVTARRLGADKLLAEVSPVLQAADIAFGNLESPFAEEIASGKMFAAPVRGAATLHEAGFNLIHLANNHVGEYGQTGLAMTLDAVRDAGMVPLGAGDDCATAQQLVRTDVNGLRIGWLGCGRTLLPQSDTGPRYWEFNEEELLAAIVQARPNIDVLIVSIHIGLMYIDYPRPEHKAMAERMMAAGAELILMHHAHVLQGVQITPQGQVCCYNLGNFLWDWEEGNVKTPVMLREQNEGAIFLFDLDQQGVASAAALPILIDEGCCVRWATRVCGARILYRLKHISRGLEENFTVAFERQRARRNTAAILKVLAFHARRGNWQFVVDSLSRARWEHFKMLVRWLTGLGRSGS